MKASLLDVVDLLDLLACLLACWPQSIDWCGRRDSNSHTFRHYPLKIACLPISPRPRLFVSGLHEETERFLAFQTTSEFTLKSYFSPVGKSVRAHYFVGIWPAPEAAGAGAAGVTALLIAGALVPGICAAPTAADAPTAGATTDAFSKTLEPDERG